jgi:hypothetical protein
VCIRLGCALTRDLGYPCARLFFRLAAPLFALAWLEPKKGAIASYRSEYALPGARQLSLSSQSLHRQSHELFHSPIHHPPALVHHISGGTGRTLFPRLIRPLVVPQNSSLVLNLRDHAGFTRDRAKWHQSGPCSATAPVPTLKLS